MRNLPRLRRCNELERALHAAELEADALRERGREELSRASQAAAEAAAAVQAAAVQAAAKQSAELSKATARCVELEGDCTKMDEARMAAEAALTAVREEARQSNERASPCMQLWRSASDALVHAAEQRLARPPVADGEATQCKLPWLHPGNFAGNTGENLSSVVQGDAGCNVPPRLLTIPRYIGWDQLTQSSLHIARAHASVPVHDATPSSMQGHDMLRDLLGAIKIAVLAPCVKVNIDVESMRAGNAHQASAL